MAANQIDTFMAAIRRLESGAYEGDYSARGPVVQSGMYAGERALGAYQIMPGNWDAWARQAGIPGADWRDPKAQDTVAAFKFRQYYSKYGRWDAVAVAWFAGGARADAYIQGADLSGINDGNASVPQYVSLINDYMAGAPQPGDQRMRTPDSIVNAQQNPDPYGSGASLGDTPDPRQSRSEAGVIQVDLGNHVVELPDGGFEARPTPRTQMAALFASIARNANPNRTDFRTVGSAPIENFVRNDDDEKVTA